MATIANATSLLVYYEWSVLGISDSLLSAIMILIAAIIGAVILWQRANAVYVWAVIAITVRSANDTPITFATFATYAGIVIVIAGAILGWHCFGKDGGNHPQDPA